MYQRPARFSFSCLSAMMPVATTVLTLNGLTLRRVMETGSGISAEQDPPWRSRKIDESTQHPSRLTLEICDRLRDNGLQSSNRRFLEALALGGSLAGKGTRAEQGPRVQGGFCLRSGDGALAHEPPGPWPPGEEAEAHAFSLQLSGTTGAFFASWIASLSTTMTPPAACHNGNLKRTKRVSITAGLRQGSSLLQPRIPCVLPRSGLQLLSQRRHAR